MAGLLDPNFADDSASLEAISRYWLRKPPKTLASFPVVDASKAASGASELPTADNWSNLALALSVSSRGGVQFSVNVGQALIVDQLAAARLNDVVFGLVFDHRSLGGLALCLQFRDAGFEPIAGLAGRTVLGRSLKLDLLVRDLVRHLRGEIGMARLEPDFDRIGIANPVHCQALIKELESQINAFGVGQRRSLR